VHPPIVCRVVVAVIVGSFPFVCPGSSSALAVRRHVWLLRPRCNVQYFPGGSVPGRGVPVCAPAGQAMKPSGPPVELVFATEFTDGGTYCARLRYASGDEVVFCVASPDAPSIMFAANRIYIGNEHPIMPHARLVPQGSDVESRLIKDLETAMAPYLSEEGRQSRDKLPITLDITSTYWQLRCAESMLRRLHEVAGKNGQTAKEPGADQATAIAEIRRGRGVVRLDETRPGKPIVAVDLKKTEVTDAGLECLVKNLTQLQHLELAFTRVTDAGLEHIKGLTELRLLDLLDTRVTDAGLEHIKGLTQLRTLWLGGTKVTDAGLARLAGLTKLEILDLGGTRVTDAALRHLKGLTQLHSLWLWDTQVTDTGLVHLKGLTQLKELYLDNSGVTDAGLRHLKGLTQLRSLWLGRTQVTDVGLGHLKGLTQLEELYLKDTRVTDAGVKELRQALPNCKIER
jgi:Leucine-rich repeat (LRR) protein